MLTDQREELVKQIIWQPANGIPIEKRIVQGLRDYEKKAAWYEGIITIAGFLATTGIGLLAIWLSFVLCQK